MQADSELGGGYGYVPWITKAPTVEEKHVVAQIVKDELRHAAVMYGLLADLGFDVESHVRQHDEIFTMRIDNNADIGTARITSDKRVNIFYYPIITRSTRGPISSSSTSAWTVAPGTSSRTC